MNLLTGAVAEALGEVRRFDPAKFEDLVQSVILGHLVGFPLDAENGSWPDGDTAFQHYGGSCSVKATAVAAARMRNWRRVMTGMEPYTSCSMTGTGLDEGSCFGGFVEALPCLVESRGRYRGDSSCSHHIMENKQCNRSGAPGRTFELLLGPGLNPHTL